MTMHPQNSIALASIQLPPSLFASPVPSTPLADCKLQLLVFRNGKLFCSTGNSSRLADDGKRRSVATPVIYAGTCKGCLLSGGLGCPMWGFSWGMELHGGPWAVPWCSCKAKPSLGVFLGRWQCAYGMQWGGPLCPAPFEGTGRGVSVVLLTRFLCCCRWLRSGKPVRAGGRVAAAPRGGCRPGGRILELRGAGGNGGLERRGVPAGRPGAQRHLPTLPAPQQRGCAHGRWGASNSVGSLGRGRGAEPEGCRGVVGWDGRTGTGGTGSDGLCCAMQELSGFPSEARGAVEVLHPAMYTCTAVLLLCLFTTIITYIVNHGWVSVLVPALAVVMVGGAVLGGVSLWAAGGAPQLLPTAGRKVCGDGCPGDDHPGDGPSGDGPPGEGLSGDGPLGRGPLGHGF